MNKHGSTSTDNGASAVESRFEGIKESVKGFVDKSGKRVDEIRSRVVGVKDEAITRGNAALDKTTELIKANPMKAVGIAFGLGYFGMRLFRR